MPSMPNILISKENNLIKYSLFILWLPFAANYIEMSFGFGKQYNEAD